MKGSKLYGLLPPLITPFDHKGNVDVEALKEVVDFLKPWVHGFYICGTYGQGPLMRPEERKLVAEKVLECSGDRKVVVHVGAPDTLTAVELARHAEDIGAHAVASVPPYYYRHHEEAVVRYFEELAASVSIPVYAYNNPPRVGYPITPELAARLKQVGVVGVKDSSFDVLTYIEYKLAAGEDFDVVVGTEALMLPTYVLGAKAFIPGMSNYLPELVYELFNALESGDLAKARELQMKVNEVRRKLHSLGSPIALTYLVLEARGLRAGSPRKPFLRPREEVARKLVEILAPFMRAPSLTG
uniref:Dihydrodipicolinate synthase family protein n=1 Tax=Thermofilum pendens TaxID=2269 RepID=A0A7J3X5F2_THEPE